MIPVPHCREHPERKPLCWACHVATKRYLERWRSDPEGFARDIVRDAMGKG